jgi:hypothetical protein
VGGRRGARTLPPANVDSQLDEERRQTQIQRIAGPLGPLANPATVRPGPVDKPSAVAHYRAMADQVAHERQLADLHRRHAAIIRAGTPREVWFMHPASRTTGARHG